MARMTVGIVQGRWSVLLVLTLMATIHTSHAFGSFELLPRSSDSCPTSYDSCGGNLPSDFCCSSSSTCISLDDATSAICCPSGASCDYISPIVCDVQQQNATTHPKNSVKTTRLDDSLPTCGEACCPFGYTCQGNSTCALDKATSSTGTSTPTTTTSSTSTDTLSTIDTATTGVTFTSVPSSSASASKETTNSATLASSCPSFPSKAVAAGFFPGAIFGAVLVLIITTCFRRRAKKKEQQEMPWEPKLKAWSQRSSTGGVIGISRPILSEDYGRSDFLLHPSPARRSYLSSRSTKSRLHRTGSRVRSLFSNGAPRLDKDAPPVPPCPITPPQQRQPSTESIKIYSPPGAFAQSRKFLGPEPYPLTLARPDTTFTDLMQVVGFNDPKGNPTYKVTVEEEKEEKERTQSKRS
ncbi:hypothetical protein N7448_002716 [Penicillium atrosanguineum]|uniref:Uncharacterized protein n=1 Tax=Penicillium atrosanguineum TaxID=1132637 RepID=A0A9W9PW44_9EURO|nr:uncharacterized protein N7443_006122 [Penicillium atrosanguineum]KAJ5145324.1 hypothetical protein N7448_002716 [Penicillium atrosanguineum]KAJ5301120.1 hypothetical protein N7443_006122 [Penicillium atrosanguineum]KAJ5311763.1 hypothetical protein N7476_007623 [Penicillium atrosanguineum]